MIYGEEFKDVDFSKGLWLADELDNIPEGYVANLVNLHTTEAGNLEIRPNYIPVDDGSNTAAITTTAGTEGYINSANPSPSFSLFANSVSFDLQSSLASSNDPEFLMAARTTNAPATTRYYWITAYGVIVTALTNTTGVEEPPKDICQYNDRYYFLYGPPNTAGGATSIYRVAFGTGTITPTLVTSSLSGIDRIVTFRDRIFASGPGQKRIYYSDLATVGGYPETWSSAFFLLPDAGASIWNMFVANDRLYIFTTAGVYQLFANGNPANWTVQLINPDVRVYAKDHVKYINGVFIYTDTKNVYAYNGGSSVIPVGDPIKYALNAVVSDYAIPLQSSIQIYDGPTNLRIMPYEDGFILNLGYHTISGGNWIQTRLPKYYYFDGRTWSEIQFDTDTSGTFTDHYEIVGTGKAIRAKVRNNEPARYNDVIVEIRKDGTTYKTVMKSVRRDNQDIDSHSFRFYYALFTADLSVATGLTLMRIKEGYAHIKSSLSNITYSPYLDNEYVTSYTPTITPEYGQFRHRLPIASIRERAFSFSYGISGTFDKTQGPSSDQSLQPWPSFRLNRLGIYINTDTSKSKDQEYNS